MSTVQVFVTKYSNVFTKPSEIIKTLGSVLQVLDYLHSQNIIHRDITPGNIIRRRSDGKLMLVNLQMPRPITTSKELEVSLLVQ